MTIRDPAQAWSVAPVAMSEARAAPVVFSWPDCQVVVRFKKADPSQIPGSARRPDQRANASASPAAGNIGLE